MSSMVASSIAKAADDVGAAASDADDRDGAPLPHERLLPATAAVAIRPPRNIRPFRALNAVASLAVGIILVRGAAVNSFRSAVLRGLLQMVFACAWREFDREGEQDCPDSLESCESRP